MKKIVKCLLYTTEYEKHHGKLFIPKFRRMGVTDVLDVYTSPSVNVKGKNDNLNLQRFKRGL